MADRFYINTTNLVTFAAGERPSADKFNAVNKYFSRGLESLAKVIGDAHDDGAPHGLGETQNIYLTNRWNKSSSKNRPLDILNLARLIGPASNLNPRYLHRAVTSNIDEVIPAGVLEYYTNFPLGSLNVNLPGTVIDFEKSMIRFSEETTEQIDITYSTKGGDVIEGGPNYIDAEFNVIPDPNTPETEADYNLTITQTVEGDYIVTLPSTGYQQSKLLDRFDTNIDVSDPNNNLQIQLPFWMNDFGNGRVIPSGSIYLKDRTTGESFLDATYTYISLTEIKVSSVELCLAEDHVFCLVTAGTDITTSIDDIRTKLFMHKHDGSFGESRISIYDLKDVFKYAPPSGPYKESALAWNAVPQYLHRDGWQEGQDSFNGENAMRGSLMMGLLDHSAEISNNSSSSNKIFFGGDNTFIQRVGNSLNINNSGNNINVLNETYTNTSSSSVTIVASDRISLGIQANSSLNAELNEVSLNGESHTFKRNDVASTVDNEEVYNPILDPLQSFYVVKIYNKELAGIEGVDTEKMLLGRIGATLNNFSLSNPEDFTSGIQANYLFVTSGVSGNAYWYENEFGLNNEGPNSGYFSITNETVSIPQNGIQKSQYQVTASIVKNKLNAYYKYCISKCLALENGDKIIIWDREFGNDLLSPNPNANVYNPAITTNLQINRGINLIQLNYSLDTMYKSTFFIEVESDYHALEADGYYDTSIYSVLSSSHNVRVTIDYTNGGIVDDEFNSVTLKQVLIDGVKENLNEGLSSIEIFPVETNSILKVEEIIINGYVFLRIEKI